MVEICNWLNIIAMLATKAIQPKLVEFDLCIRYFIDIFTAVQLKGDGAELNYGRYFQKKNYM